MITKIELLILNEQMLLEIIQGLVLLRSNVQGQFTAVGSVRWTAAQLCFHSPCTRKQMCSEVNLRENRTQKHSTNTCDLSVSIQSFNSTQHCSNVTPAWNRTHAFIKSVITILKQAWNALHWTLTQASVKGYHLRLLIIYGTFSKWKVRSKGTEKPTCLHLKHRVRLVCHWPLVAQESHPAVSDQSVSLILF